LVARLPPGLLARRRSTVKASASCEFAQNRIEPFLRRGTRDMSYNGKVASRYEQGNAALRQNQWGKA